MNKAQLIDTVAERLEINRKQAADAVEEIIGAITEAVAEGERVALTGFGVFEKVERKARTGRNPATGAIVKIKAKGAPKFRPGAEFKGIVEAGKKSVSRRVSGASKAAPKAPAKKAPAKKASAQKAPVKKAAAKKAPVKKAAAKKAPAKKATAKKTTSTRKTAKK